MIVKTEIVTWFGASAITVFPFIFIRPHLAGLNRMTIHEKKHLEQQKRWAIYGLGVGLLVWYFLYLFCFPVGLNPWRYKWEAEAFLTDKTLSIGEINTILALPPYHLWWH
jgi:hypothetical protein